jgi:hypothetical protein
MSTTQALATRRAAFAATALAATVVVHAATAGALELLPIAPALWGVLVCAALLCGSRDGAFRLRGAPRTFALLLAGQAALHLVLVKAPWALGVRPHHDVPLLTCPSLLGHLGVALVLAVALAKGERILVALTRAVAAIRRRLDGRRPRRPVPPARLEARVVAPLLPLHISGTPTRGPPRRR